MFCGQVQIQILKQPLCLKKLCIIPKTSHSSWNLVVIIYFTIHISSGCCLKIFVRSTCCYYKLKIFIIFCGNGTWNKVYFTELVVFIFIIIIVIILHCVLFSGSYHSSIPISFLITKNMADSTHKLQPPCCKQVVVGVCGHQQSVFSNNKNTNGTLWKLGYNTYVKCQSKRSVNVNLECFLGTRVPNMWKCFTHQIPI